MAKTRTNRGETRILQADGRVLAVESGVLKSHKYALGQTVQYTAGPLNRVAVDSTFKVVKLLPPDGDEYQYRIKSQGEAFERVAKESQLDRFR